MADKKKKKPVKGGDLTTVIERLRCLAECLNDGDWEGAWSDVSDVIDEIQDGFKGGAKFKASVAEKDPKKLAEQLEAHAASLEEDGCFCEETSGKPELAGAAGGLDWTTIIPLILTIVQMLLKKKAEAKPASEDDDEAEDDEE